jgi:predicted enzyme related to lactoylglutathione lyase
MKKTSFAPGEFCWADLAPAKASDAVKFYAAVFGWSTREVPIPNGKYTLCTMGEDVVAGIVPDVKEHPHWNLYVNVADVDASAKKAASLGGKVLREPGDVGDRGRTAQIADPSGARLWLWKGNQRAGVGRVRSPAR